MQSRHHYKNFSLRFWKNKHYHYYYYSTTWWNPFWTSLWFNYSYLMYSLYFTFDGKNDSNKSISECIFHLQFKMTKFEWKNKGIGEKSSSVFKKIQSGRLEWTHILVKLLAYLCWIKVRAVWGRAIRLKPDNWINNYENHNWHN